MRRFVRFAGSSLAVMLCCECAFGANNAPASELFMLDGVSIGNTSLAEIRARYGMAGARRLGNEDESDVQICYFSRTGGASVSFETGVMGAMKYVTAYRIASGKPAGTCFPTTVEIRKLGTPNGIRLGMMKGEFVKAAGVAFSENGCCELKYEGVFKRAQGGSSQEEFDVTIRVTGAFVSDRLIDLRVEKFESN